MCLIASEELQARVLRGLPARGRISALELLQRLSEDDACLSHYCAAVLALLDDGRARTEDALGGRTPAELLRARLERAPLDPAPARTLIPDLVFFPDRCLGRGQAAAVYRGEDRRSGTPLAVKVLEIQGAPAPELRDWYVERFRQEPCLMASIEHPHVVKVLAWGEAAEGPWYAMELLDGGTLARRLRRERRLPPKEVRAAFRALASALAAAARRGIAHRDVKPANIFVPDFKLADFGMAKVGWTAPGAERSITSYGARVGTPAYMAPERASFGTGDERSDLYSLGATMYQAATGSPLFDVPFDDAREWAARHLRAAPVPAAERAPGLSGGLSEVIMRCLAKAPGERYPGFDALVSALDALPPES